MLGVVLRGLLTEEESKVSDVTSKMKYGKFTDLKPGCFGIVLGIELARSLHVQVGEKVTLAGAPEGQITPAGMVPRLK
ncbi:lipoprotein-releasing system transmembrane subunit LolC, partial [Undibacterium sp. 10I3]|nr:lipoprotein-releasing system transmembrane subunit LolC [Undibacterium sp. 10I3]